MKGFSSFVLRTALLTAFAVAGVLIPKNSFAFSAVAQQIQGEVLILKAGDASGNWIAITGDTALNSGDSIKTRKGSCVLTYSDQATFAMEADSSVTVEEKSDTQDLKLLIGKLRGNVNKLKVTKPFQVMTPAAVAAVRGTDVNFDFNEKGQLTVDLQNGGPVQVFNETAQMNLNLTEQRSITVAYDPKTGIVTIKNNCDSKGNVVFSVLGTEYSVKPCDQKEVGQETAGGGPNQINPPGDDNPETPDTHGDPSSPI